MILSGNSSYPKTWLVFPYLTEVVTQFMCHLLFQVDSLKDICEETLRKDIDNDTVLLCLGVAEQFSVSRLKVRTIDVPYCSYKLRSWSKVWLKKSLFFLSFVFPLAGTVCTAEKMGSCETLSDWTFLSTVSPTSFPVLFLEI